MFFLYIITNWLQNVLIQLATLQEFIKFYKSKLFVIVSFTQNIIFCILCTIYYTLKLLTCIL